MKLEAKLDPADLSALMRAAKEAEGTVQIELRRGIKAAAKPVVDRTKERASFSTRIPGAVKVQTRFPAKGASVTVTVDSKRAPHAAPINNQGREGTFRHPVYPDPTKERSEWNWAPQQAHPFFPRTANDVPAQVETEMLRVMDEIAHKLGFH